MGPVAFVAADFDKNGGADLAVTNAIYSTHTVTVILNEATVALYLSSLSFPETVVGSKSKPLTLRLSNPGTTSLAVHSIAISGADPGDFTETNNCGKRVQVTKVCAVTVEFLPTARGKRSAVLTIKDNALRGTQSVPLTGTGD
jgi:hypothetical protein